MAETLEEYGKRVRKNAVPFKKDIDKVRSKKHKNDSERKKELISIYKKYDRKIPYFLTMKRPVNKKKGGSIKKKPQSGHNRLY
jgi:hypothetical protein